MKQIYSSRPDFKKAPVDNPDVEWYTDECSFIEEGKKKAGYPVMSVYDTVESGLLLPKWLSFLFPEGWTYNINQGT